MAQAVSTVILRYPSLVQWLADHLAAVTSVDLVQDALPHFAFVPESLGTLASPLPLKLASQYQTTPEIAGLKLIAQLNQGIDQSWLAPKFWLHPNGWLYTHFPATALAKWLQFLLYKKPELYTVAGEKTVLPAYKPGISNNPCIFQLQYAHARCCSLMHLAQQKQHFQRTIPDPKMACFGSPQRMPWLTEIGQWRLQNSAEQQLISQLMLFPQPLAGQKVIYGDPQGTGQETTLTGLLSDALLEQQAYQWSNAFLSFYRECRLFADDSVEVLALGQARLGLVHIVRQILAFWLEVILQVEAPSGL